LPAAAQDAAAAALQLPLAGTNRSFLGAAQGQSIQWTSGEERHAGPFGPAPLVAGGAAVENAAPTFSRAGQASYGAFIYVEGKPNGSAFSRMNKAQGYRGWDLF